MGLIVHSSETRSCNVYRKCGMDTKLEVKLHSLLRGEGRRFKRYEPGLPGQPDMVPPKYRTATIVSGCLWCRHEGRRYCSAPRIREEFCRKKLSENIIWNKKKTEQLEEPGSKAFAIWECELKDKTQSTCSGLIEQFDRDEY